MNWHLEHITKENGKWYAELVNEDDEIEHTGDVFGWNGMTYRSLSTMLSEYYKVNIPDVKSLNLLKRTANRCIYTL